MDSVSHYGHFTLITVVIRERISCKYILPACGNAWFQGFCKNVIIMMHVFAYNAYYFHIFWTFSFYFYFTIKKKGW